MKFYFHRFSLFLIVTLAIIFVSTSYAQTANFLWANRGGGSADDVARGITSDNFGNLIVTGSFKDNAYLGGQQIASAGAQDIFLAKYDNKGDVRWVKKWGAIARDFAFDVDADRNGNSIITGLFSRSVNFDSFTLTSAGSGDMFTAKIDPSGKVIWVSQAGGTSIDGGNEIATDADGNALVIANTYGTVRVGNIVLNHQGEQDSFIAKYNQNGNLLWAQQIAGPNNEQGRGISADKQGNVLVTGEFNGTLNFGARRLQSSSNLRDIFLAKYTSAGNVLWAKSFGSSGEDYGRGIDADGAGNIYFAGVFSGTVKFDRTTLNSIGGSQDLFLAKADASGRIIWVRQMGGPGPDEGCEIEVDEQGNSYVSGEFPNTATFASKVLTSAGARDLFIAKFDPQGNLIWIEQAGGNSDDVNYAIALDNTGRVTTVGTFAGSATFGNFTVSSINNSVDFFVAQLGRKQN